MTLTAGQLGHLDRGVRRWARSFLSLPTSLAKAFFYADVRDGGLQLPCFSDWVPSLKRARFARLGLSELPSVVAARSAGLIDGTLRWCRQRLPEALDHAAVRSRWGLRWHSSVDGGPLASARMVPESTSWIRSTRGPGRAFVEAVRLRTNSLPTRTRVARGRPQAPVRCRACGAPAETLVHVLQACPRSYSARLVRHERLLALAAAAFRRTDHQVLTEAPFRTAGGERLVPDIVALKGRTAYVVDVTVSGTNLAHPNAAHDSKVRKYAVPGLRSAILDRFRRSGVGRVVVSALAIDLRGLLCPKSVTALRGMGFVSQDFEMISRTVVDYGARTWAEFNRRCDVYGLARYRR